MRATMYTDGSTNYGIGVLILSENVNATFSVKVFRKKIEPIADIEYLALGYGLRRALDLGVTHIDMKVDNYVVISNLLGRKEVKPEHHGYYDTVMKLLSQFEGNTLSYCKGEENIADGLSRGQLRWGERGVKKIRKRIRMPN